MNIAQSPGKAQAAVPPPLTNHGQQWLTAAEAAQYLKIEARTLLDWARRGKVRAYQLSGTKRHVWRFRTVDLDAILFAPSVALHTKGVQ